MLKDIILTFLVLVKYLKLLKTPLANFLTTLYHSLPLTRLLTSNLQLYQTHQRSWGVYFKKSTQALGSALILNPGESLHSFSLDYLVNPLLLVFHPARPHSRVEYSSPLYVYQRMDVWRPLVILLWPQTPSKICPAHSQTYLFHH